MGFGYITDIKRPEGYLEGGMQLKTYQNKYLIKTLGK
jgi:hypothetical protein